MNRVKLEGNEMNQSNGTRLTLPPAEGRGPVGDGDL
jgi:hypothetical protein